jgi:hypothetical protein
MRCMEISQAPTALPEPNHRTQTSFARALREARGLPVCSGDTRSGHLLCLMGLDIAASREGRPNHNLLGLSTSGISANTQTSAIPAAVKVNSRLESARRDRRSGLQPDVFLAPVSSCLKANGWDTTAIEDLNRRLGIAQPYARVPSAGDSGGITPIASPPSAQDSIGKHAHQSRPCRC